MSREQRFQRYGKGVDLDKLIRDCRELQEEVVTLQTQLAEIKKRIEALESGGP